MGSDIKTPSILILVPSRFGSSRFPGKPLAKILDKPLVQWTYEHISNHNYPPGWDLKICVVTDDDRIEQKVKDFGGNVIRVDDDVSTGTERIALAWERNYGDEVDLVINVQGDEPLMRGSDLEKLIKFHLDSAFDIGTMTCFHADLGEMENPNRVKAVFDLETGKCSAFTRKPVEPVKDGWYLHIGVYSYRPDALKKFVSLPPSENEIAERLEQLRGMDNGLTIGAITIENELMGVDTPEDIPLVEGVLRGQSK